VYPEPVANVRNALTAAGAEDTVTVFDAGVPTAAAAAAALGCDIAAITNSLVFELAGARLLILASGAARVDVNKVASYLGTGRIRRATPEFVLAHTGQAVGGVAPVGHPEKIRTLLDSSLRQHPVLWAGAGDHNSMFSIGY
jgi:prolyl-tRNA editing enzyme YbaK/EbsC (Cys-tRNA(Pro) deacylase)